jgi:hypothetical protein
LPEKESGDIVIKVPEQTDIFNLSAIRYFWRCVVRKAVRELRVKRSQSGTEGIGRLVHTGG